MRLQDFDYELPERLIAQEPLERRDASRLMVVHRRTGVIEHRLFPEIVAYLQAGDLMVVNETKVLPVRLFGRKSKTAGRVEVLLLHPTGPDRWECLVRPGRRLQPGARVEFGPELLGEVVARTPSGGREIVFMYEGSFESVLARVGHVPLPPYIRKPLGNAERYQTVYARSPGSAAAPTAGMHFTPELLETLRTKGVQIASVVLHIGLDTFRPVKVDDISKHEMHTEYYAVPEGTSLAVNAAKREGRRVVAIGTTSTR
ncbi:tRNA preQ1(34) S-adenosylmethionine ribosyltransferase-isomerase QueA, partial [Desulforudis sp. 1190]